MPKKKENENSRVEKNSDGEKISLKREILEGKMGNNGENNVYRKVGGGKEDVRDRMSMVKLEY